MLSATVNSFRFVVPTLSILSLCPHRLIVFNDYARGFIMEKENVKETNE